MKPSKIVWIHYILGLICLFVGTVGSFFKDNLLYFVFGLTTNNLLWIMGIQKDLYKKEVKR